MRPNYRFGIARNVPVLASLLFALCASVAHAGAPTYLWSRRFGTISVDQVTAMAIDATHNVYITGSCSSPIDFGGGALPAGDAYLAKFDSNGNHVWSKTLGGANTDFPLGLGLDNAGNPIVAGYFFVSTNMGGATLTSAGSQDLFIAKFAASTGAHTWSVSYGGTGVENMIGMAVDGSGDVFLGGQFGNTINLGGVNLSSPTFQDGYIVKYNSTGLFQWQKQIGTASGDDGVQGLAADAAGNVYATGQFSATVDFGGGGIATHGSTDVFLLKLDTTGAHQWSKGFGGTGGDIGKSVALNSTGTKVVIGGNYNTSINLGGGALTSYGSADMFVGMYDANGAYQWGHHYGATSADNFAVLSIGGDGGVAFTGSFSNTAHFGAVDLVSTATSDMFVARTDAAGNLSGARDIVHLNNGDTPRAIASDPNGNFAFGGFFSSTSDFGGGVLTSAGAQDIFLAMYSPANDGPYINSIKDVGNDQGRLVNVRFTRSAHDGVLPVANVTSYEVYRKDAAPPAAAAGLESAPRPQLRDLGWTFVGSVPAHTQPSYALDCPTIGDSTIALGGYNSTFFVRASTATTSTFYNSDPDSGYSVDNLAPGIPGLFSFTAGNLTWKESSAKDFDYFTVYGASVDSFSGATLVNYTVGTNMNVAGSPYAYYYVTATDFSGNEGQPARVHAATGVGDTPQSYVLSVANYPNPFNPLTNVKYTVPSRGMVDISVYDASGAHVATLFHGERNAGAYAIEWNGRATGGATAASGIYFARITLNGETRTKKMVLLK